HDLPYKDISALYAAVGEGHMSPENVVDRLLKAVGGEEGAQEDRAEATRPSRARPATRDSSPAIIVGGMADTSMLKKLARCCTPVPGDEIKGFITRGQGVSVHRADCTNLKNLGTQEEGRLIDVEWESGQDDTFFHGQNQDEALGRNGLLSDVTQMLSDSNVNILSANVVTTTDRETKMKI